MLIIMQTALPLSKQTSLGWLFTFETSTLLEASCFAQLLYTAAAATASACSLEQHKVCTDWKHATVVPIDDLTLEPCNLETMQLLCLQVLLHSC